MKFSSVIFFPIRVTQQPIKANPCDVLKCHCFFEIRDIPLPSLALRQMLLIAAESSFADDGQQVLRLILGTCSGG